MAYQLEARERVPAGIERIIREQIERAIEELTGQTNNSQDEAVHEARRCFKKIRAVLRLVRAQLPQAVYQRENLCFRDAGRHLSDLRDAQVRLETLEKLAKEFPDAIPSEGLRAVRLVLEASYGAVSEQMHNGNEAVPSVVAALKAARERVAAWPEHHDSWSAMEGGLKRAYKLGRQGLRRAASRPTVANLHSWRKRVKDLWYHLLILAPVWPRVMAALAKEARDLSDYLGDDHDLAVLHQFIVESVEGSGNSAQGQGLIALIERRRAQLQWLAQSAGQRLYAEAPENFVNRIGAYWQVWRSPLEESDNH